jgi:integrase
MEFEQEIKDYLALKGKDTAGAYASAFRKFLEFYQTKYGKGAGFSHFLDRIFEEFKKPMRDQGRIAETELSQFVDYLKNKELINNKKLSNNTIRLYFAALQNFLKYKQIVVSMSFINVPPPTEKVDGNDQEINGKHEWKIEQIKKFVDAASTYRDKAIIVCMFQSGLGVNEICRLNYGHIKDELEAGILPICLKLVRQKTKVKFKSFFGRDAVHYLKLYLATRGKLKPGDPLFTKERIRGKKEDGEKRIRITPTIIQQSFSEIAKGLTFIKQNGGYNGARPHSLRAAFNSQLINKIDETLREFWMGHDIGAQARAYLNMPTEDMRQLYMTAETYLKIEKTSREEQDEIIKGKSTYSEIVESEVKELRAKVERMETFMNKLLDFNPEEFQEMWQDYNRKKFAQQKEEDKKQFETQQI